MLISGEIAFDCGFTVLFASTHELDVITQGKEKKQKK